MAAALNLDDVAKSLLALDLVSATAGGVMTSGALSALSHHADSETFSHLARILLERAPPPWLKVAVTDTGVRREYIPEAELEALAWLGDRLDDLLVAVSATIGDVQEDTFRKRIGDAAEHLVMAALRRRGGEVAHVAALSDRFGYDIEHRRPDEIHRLEVKAATSRTAAAFFLSRNEFEKSQSFGDDWRIVQVVFAPSVLLAAEITGAHVVQVRELSAAKLFELVTSDTPEFAWQESARLTPPATSWGASSICIEPADIFEERP